MTKITTLNSAQIGGNVVVIETQMSKIAIDFGANLPGNNSKNIEINGVSKKGKPFDGVFFTHYHADHMGRMKDILPEIPLYIGEVAKKVLLNINKAIKDTEMTDLLNDSKRVFELRENTPVVINGGDIVVTPYTVDHSAYEAFMFLIETKDKTILHTGDFREHGYRGKKGLIPVIEKYIRKNGKRDIDILITEGTMFSRMNEAVFTESELQKWAKEFFKQHRHVFLICSSANLDSLAGFYHAGQNYGMQMFGNWYVVSQLKTFSETAGKKSSLYRFDKLWRMEPDKLLEKNGFKGTQEDYMRKYGFICIVKPEEYCEQWIERFADCNPVLIYSMWDGYLKPQCSAYDKKMDKFCKKYNAVHKHTSGHATAETIAKVINAVNPKEAIYPIHTGRPEMIYNLNISEELKKKVVIKNKKFLKEEILNAVEKFVNSNQYLILVNRDDMATIYYKDTDHIFLRFKNKRNPLMAVSFKYAKDDTENLRKLKDAYGFEDIGDENFYVKNLDLDETFLQAFYASWTKVLDKRFCKKEKKNTRTIDFVEAFAKDGALEAVTEFVKDEDKRLCLLFRGNSGDGKAIVYYKNHVFLSFMKKQKGYEIGVSIDHINCYSGDVKEIYEKLEKLGFVSEKNVYRPKKIGKDEAYSRKDLEKFYEVWIPVMDNFFKKKPFIEKERQQELFLDFGFKNTKDGYFVYDLEYQATHENLDETRRDKDNNKPDFLAIRYENSKPAALVVGEVKSTLGACKDKSGVEAHLSKMKNLRTRAELNAIKNDVVQLMEDYKKIGLKYCDITQVEVDNLTLELLFIFTDDSREWLKDNRAVFDKYNDVIEYSELPITTLKTEKGIEDITCIQCKFLEFKGDREEK